MSQTSHNWLVYRIGEPFLRRAIQRYARGVLVDIGCGEKPYVFLTSELVTQHWGIDHPDSLHAKTSVDLFATAYATGIANSCVDTILCTVVLEHLERPQDAVHEMYRILRPGGHVLLTAPFFWHLHEPPRDFYRYSSYGLHYLFTTAGFEIVELVPLSGFIVTFAQELVYYLQRFRRGVLTYPMMGLQFVIQRIAYSLNRWDHSYEFSWLHLLVVRKPV